MSLLELNKQMHKCTTEMVQLKTSVAK